MVIYFPSLLPDELFYSACSRYHRIAGDGIDLFTSRDIFGEDINVFPWDLPDRLKLFMGNLPIQESLKVEDIVEQHTMFPFYRPFLSKHQAKQVLTVMYGKQTKNKRSRIMVGACGSNLPLVKFLRCCPRCINEDEKNYGVSYWHRSHQVHGVFVCHRHKIPLWITRAPTSHLSGISMFLTLEKDLIDKPLFDQSLTSAEFGHLVWFADFIAWLLDSNLDPIGRNELRKRYERFLLNNDAFSRNGKIWIKKVQENIQSVLGDRLLHLMQCPFEEKRTKTWIYRLFHCQGFGPNPLHHLVLIHSLGLEVKEIQNGWVNEGDIGLPQCGPFGDGPWPCLNPASDHYRENVVTECQVVKRINDGTPVGTFSCDKCGFIYRRSGPDKSSEDRFRKNRVISYGEVFEESLLELYELQKLSFREIGRLLNVDKSVVSRKIRQAKNPQPMKFEDDGFVGERESRRKGWIEFLNENPDLTRNDIYKKHMGKVSWFYRNDRIWFQHHLPPTKITTSSHVDWNSRDTEFEQKIEEAVVKIQAMRNPLVRVSVGRISQVLHIGDILYKAENLEKMPKTKEMLRGVVESLEKFQIRKLQF